MFPLDLKIGSHFICNIKQAIVFKCTDGIAGGAWEAGALGNIWSISHGLLDYPLYCKFIGDNAMRVHAIKSYVMLFVKKCH